jgi:hypothetical protein
MEHFLAGLWLALGACVGMVLWQFIAWALNTVKVACVAVLAAVGIIKPFQVNAQGERVFPNKPKGDK